MKKNKGMHKSSSMIAVNTIHTPIVHVCTKFQPSRSDEKFYCLRIGEKKTQKKTNKGMNKQQQPDSGIYDTSADCPLLYQVSIF